MIQFNRFAQLLLFALVFSLSFSNAYASGFGWYVSAFDWNTFAEQHKRLKETKPEQKAQKLAEQIIYEMTDRRGEEDSNTLPFNFSSEEFLIESEYYWEDSLDYAHKKLISKGLLFNNFNRFTQLNSSINLHPLLDSVFDAYFVLSPEDVEDFYKQVKILAATQPYPEDYASDLLHIEGVFLKTSNQAGRGLIFFGHD